MLARAWGISFRGLDVPRFVASDRGNVLPRCAELLPYRIIPPQTQWRTTMIRKITTAAVISAAIALAACNTVQGAKEDVNSAGKAVSNATDGK
jgi:predicted small secreted protein